MILKNLLKADIKKTTGPDSISAIILFCSSNEVKYLLKLSSLPSVDNPLTEDNPLMEDKVLKHDSVDDF